jgi:hypothetical protein
MNAIRWSPSPPEGFAILAKKRISHAGMNPAALEVLAKTEGFITDQVQDEIRGALMKEIEPPGELDVPFVYTIGPAIAHVNTPTGASVDITVWYKTGTQS